MRRIAYSLPPTTPEPEGVLRRYQLLCAVASFLEHPVYFPAKTPRRKAIMKPALRFRLLNLEYPGSQISNISNLKFQTFSLVTNPINAAG
jgi:hypothetical protein